MNGQVKSKAVLVAALAVLFIWPMSSAVADTLGENRIFKVNSEYDAYKRSSLTATLRHVGEHAYFYVDDRYWDETLSSSQRDAAIAQIAALSEEFDMAIYPKETSTWGAEPNPGVDKDSRIVILLEDLVSGNGGYFETVNGFTKDRAPESNQREMLTISIKTLNSGLLKSFLAHEFQHLISFQQKELTSNVSEETWLNELRSEYSTTLVGYSEPYADSGLARRVRLFIDNPSDSLTEWPNATQDYSMVAVFGEYLVGRYGVNILSDSLKLSSIGLRSLEQYLAGRGVTEPFYRIFGDWMVASYINDAASDYRYGYVNPSLKSIRVSPGYRSYVSEISGVTTYTIKAWQPVWHEFNMPHALSNNEGMKVALTGVAGDSFGVALAVFYDDGSFGVYNDKPIDGSFTIYALNPERIQGEPERRITRILLAATYIPVETVTEGNYPAHTLTSTVSTVTASSAQEALEVSPAGATVFNGGTVSDGVLVKRNNAEPEMYVIYGKYKRYLRPDIIRLYGHLNQAQAVPLAGGVFDLYQTSNYVRGVNDKKVYAVWPDGTKHWLNITARQWDASGRDWGAIFIINDAELAAYRTGIDIVK